MSILSHTEQLIAQAKSIAPHYRVNGRDTWVYGDYTVTYNFVRDAYTVAHTPITYSMTPPAGCDWTHTSTICDLYTFRVYPLPTGGEWRVPINDAAIEAYEAGKDDDGLYAWEWMAQWLAECEAPLQTESEGEETRRLQ